MIIIDKQLNKNFNSLKKTQDALDNPFMPGYIHDSHLDV